MTIEQKLVSIADACRRADGSDIPLGQTLREAVAHLKYYRERIADLEDELDGHRQKIDQSFK